MHLQLTARSTVYFSQRSSVEERILQVSLKIIDLQAPAVFMLF